MHEVTPKVYLISTPTFIYDFATEYLDDIEASSFADKRYVATGTPEVPDLIEFAGRICYKSWEPGLNPNVTRIREDQTEYIRNIIASQHGSVLAHAQYVFVFQNVSRVFTHELLRHQAGARPEDQGDLLTAEGISQESQRYVRTNDLGFWFPDCFDVDDKQLITEHIEETEKLIGWFYHKYDLDNPKGRFADKKKMTSAIRRLLPQGISTDMVWSANLRTIRHCLEARTSEGAEEEIRKVYQDVGSIMKAEIPEVFSDYIVNNKGEWTTPYRKV